MPQAADRLSPSTMMTGARPANDAIGSSSNNSRRRSVLRMSDPSMRPAIEVVDLVKRVASPEGELIILREVQFSIQAGESVAIVGASGSGKTTLLGILAGLDTPSSGQVIIDGVDIFSLDEDGRAGLRRRSIGFVFQSFQLLPN